MNSYQESYEKMSATGQAYLLGNAPITDTLPGFTGYITVVIDCNARLLSFKVKQEAARNGNSANKPQLRVKLITETMDIARRATAYATNENNNNLLNLVNYTESELKRCTDSNLVSVCQLIKDNAHAEVTSLEAYGVVPESLESLQTSITQFNDAIPKVRLDLTESADITKQIGEVIKTLIVYWGKIDTLIEMVRLSHPSFYEGYQKVRKIIPAGVGSLDVKGVVTDAATKEPIKGVSITFELKDADGTIKASTESMVKKTAEKGGFYIKSLPSGIYLVTFKKVGYVDYTVTVVIADNEQTDIDVQLSKI